MSLADDNLDTSTTALLQPDSSADQIAENHDEELASLTNNSDNNQQEQEQQQQSQQTESQPTTSSSTTTQQQSEGGDNAATTSTTPPQQNGDEDKSSSEPQLQQESSSPSDDLKIVNENQQQEEDNQNQKPSETAADPSSESPNEKQNLTEVELNDSSSPNATTTTTTTTTTTSTSNKKPSRSKRIRNAINSLPAEKVQKARMATSIEDIGSLRLWKGIVAEFLGTLLLTFVGCGSCINLKGDKNVTSPVVQIALCFGLSVATIVWAIGHVSGGHINPAVTVAMLATRKISLAKAAFFIIFQLIGAVVGAGLLYGLTPSDFHSNLGATLVSDHLNVGQAVGVEIFITFVLVFVVFASVDSKRRDLNGSTPLTIGLSVTMCHLFAIDFTGSSMNTARSFGPAVVMGKWNDHWVYWLGPILGGVLAGLLYDNLFAVNASLSKAKACMLSSDYDDERYQAQKMKIRILEEDPDEPKEDLALDDKIQADGDPSNA